MSELSKKKNVFENTGDKAFYNINSFRGLNMDRNKQNNEIKINNNNLTSRIIFEINNKQTEKSRTISKNKIIGNKLLTASKNDYSKYKNKTLLEMSYNQKNSPKKLFAETSKKNNYLQTQYKNGLISKNTNGYIACFTEDSEARNPEFGEKIEKNFKKIINTEKNENRVQQPGAFLNTSNDDNTKEKSKLNFNYKKQSIQFKPIRVNASAVTRREIISPTNRDKENITSIYFSNVNETSLIQNNLNISKTQESVLTNAKRNNGGKIIEKKNNFLTEFVTEPKGFNDKNNSGKRNIASTKIKLEDGISINIIKSHGEKRIKKFLHIPDFEIYVIKEIPLNYDSIQNVNVSERIKNWNSKMSFSDNFVKIYKEHINSPEGYISLVYEYMDGFSLGDVIENLGCLNENLYQKICYSLLKCLAEYEENNIEDYGELCPCNIMFDKYGNLKLNPRILNCCSKDSDPLNPQRNNLNDFFNKCNCYDFFHNNLRNKIRIILREITKENDMNPINENQEDNAKQHESANKSNELIKAVNSKKEFNVDSRKSSDANRNSSNNRFKANSNNSTRKNTSEFNNNNEDYDNLKTEQDQKGESANDRVDSENIKNEKNQISKTQSKKSLKINNAWENEKGGKKASILRSGSQKSKQINKQILNNYFISEKNLKSKLKIDRITVKEFEANDKLKQNLNLNLFNKERNNSNNNNKKDAKSNENSKGFSNYNSNCDSANYFNKKSSVNTNSNVKLTANESNRFIANNSNGMSEVNKLNGFPNASKNTPHHIILNTDLNVNKTNELNEFEIFKLNEADKENRLFSQIRDGIANIHGSNSRGSLNNDNKSDTNSSSNPKISIMNNFVFSSDKGLNRFSADKNKQVKLDCENQNLSHSNNNYLSSIPIKNHNKDFNVNINSNNQKEDQSEDNYFSAKIAKADENNANTSNKQNYNSIEFSKRMDTQGYLDTNANTNERMMINNKLSIDPSKIKNLKITNFDFPKQYFSLGYIFIILACRSIKLKIFEYLENLSIANLEEIKGFKLKKCCLYHFLISLEDAIKIKKNYSIENFFKSYSEELKNFICNLTVISLSNRQKTRKKCLQGYPIFYLNAKSLLEHPWLKSENNFSAKLNNNNKINNMKLSLREVLKIVRESFKTSLVEFNEKKYENVLNKLEVILNNHRNEFKVEIIREALENKKNIIKAISTDLGVNFQDFYERIIGLVDKIFLEKYYKNN